MKKGFTLAELLIALVILGVIATFTIPKILTAQANAQRESVLKETIAMMSNLVYEGYLTGNITNDNDASWMMDKVNAIQLCPNGAVLDGCWTEDDTLLIPSTCPGFRLASGAVVVSCMLGGPEGTPRLAIDANGEEGPNAINEDQIELMACFDANPCTPFSRTHAPGTVIPNEFSKGNADSTPGYEALFSN
ncbi:MAG: type II secretion system protein [Vampirovibrionales bacterium]|nr:type II secretion system protein [Vampirovibrionales bacterium]